MIVATTESILFRELSRLRRWIFFYVSSIKYINVNANKKLRFNRRYCTLIFFFFFHFSSLKYVKARTSKHYSLSIGAYRIISYRLFADKNAQV